MAGTLYSRQHGLVQETTEGNNSVSAHGALQKQSTVLAVRQPGVVQKKEPDCSKQLDRPAPGWHSCFLPCNTLQEPITRARQHRAEQLQLPMQGRRAAVQGGRRSAKSTPPRSAAPTSSAMPAPETKTRSTTARSAAAPPAGCQPRNHLPLLAICPGSARHTRHPPAQSRGPGEQTPMTAPAACAPAPTAAGAGRHHADELCWILPSRTQSPRGPPVALEHAQKPAKPLCRLL